jgi:TonB-linked SusC/RagA family outer membrane protein
LNALQGQASGVNVITCGVPGSTSQIYVRGLTSFGDNKPLVLVDGVPGDLDNVNTTDVESIQVLKDAGAAAIYGTRGSNGVIIVTTKKGEQGDPVVTYEGYCGFTNNLGKNPYNLVNSEEYMNLVLTATPTSLLFKGGMPDYSFRGPTDAGTAMTGDTRIDPANYNLDLENPENRYLIFKVNKEGTDWYSEMYKPAFSTNHNVSVTGGTQKVNYLLSLGYLDQQGTLLETYFKRYSTRVNLECKVNKNFRIGQNLYYYYRDQNTPGDFDSESMAYGMLPIIPVYDIMGNLAGTYAGIELGSYVNPVGTRKRTLSDRDNSWVLTGSVFAEVDFLKYFKARTNIGAFVGNYYTINFSPKVYDNAESSVRNSLSESSSYSSKKIWTNTLDFTKSFGKHTLNVLGGTEFILNRGRSLTGGSSVFFSEDFSFCILGNGSENITNSSSGSETALFSVFSRLDYSYDKKYLISGTIRRDGSSRFGSGKKYGYFPSVSLGWRISHEDFMKDITWLDDLKIRASYGILGSEENVNPDNAYNLYTSSNKSSYYNITGSYNTITQGFHQSRLGNPNTGWESDIIANAGFDATLFNNSLEISLEGYSKSIEGLLFTEGLPAIVGGATYPTVNIGDVKNTGFDFSLTYHGKIKSEIKYHIGANITAYKNEIINIPDPGWFASGSYVRNEVGHPISSFFGYKVTGIFNNPDEVAAAPTQSAAAPGSFRFQNTNDDEVISADDRVFLGSPHPDFTYGINIRFEYKGFDLSAIFFGSQGNEIVNATKFDTHFFGAYVGNKSKDMLNAWTPENTSTMQPKVSLGSNFSTSSFSSWFVEDGSYLKCRSIRLGYTFNPASFVGRIGGKNLRLYVEGKNLFTITKYSGLDPEVGSSSSAAFGIDDGRYPGTEKNYILGLNISF